MEKYISDFIKILTDNVRAVIKGDFEEGVTDLNTLCNLALLRIDRKSVTPSLRKIPALSSEQKRKLHQFYAPYVRFMTSRYHRLYLNKSGKFYPEYLPEEFYAMHIDRYYSNREEARFLDHKGYYYKLFSHVKQPELVVMRIGTTWLNHALKPVSFREVLSELCREPEVVLKKAVNSEGGYGVMFLNGGNIAQKFCRAMNSIHCDVVVQRPVRQHPLLAQLHPQSVNTMRIVSLMTGNQVKIYAVALKIGTGSSRTDNGCQGGIYCGVNHDGTLKDYGILDNGTVLKTHPDLQYAFAVKKIPCLTRAIRLVKEAHSFMGHFRLISWDVTVDENGEAVLIEANLSLGGINDVQMCCGPLFGRDTRKILNEATQGKRRITTLL